MKLTSADSTGMIIVWVLYKGVWFEEMVNNRQKSPVMTINWNHDGKRIGILYEDGGIKLIIGGIIVGSVDGGRIWGRDLKLKCKFLVWTPDSRFLFIFTRDHEIHLFDGGGTPVAKFKSLGGIALGDQCKFIAADWYSGVLRKPHAAEKPFALLTDKGTLLLLQDEKDASPLLIETALTQGCLKWNHNGTALAVGGKFSNGEILIQFYDSFGIFIRTLKVPGSSIQCITWEHGGLRLSFAVDAFIYFANIRPNYQWCYLSNSNLNNNQDGTICYHYYPTDPTAPNLVFFNTRTRERFIKTVSNLSLLTSYDDLCMMAIESSEEAVHQVLLNLCNSMGAILDSRILEFHPMLISMNKTMAICIGSDHSLVYTWAYKATKLSAASGFARIASALESTSVKGKERWFHIDDVSVKGSEPNQENTSYLDIRNRPPSFDPIMLMTASENSCIILRKSGRILHFSLPRFTLECTYEQFVGQEIPFQSIHLNSNSSKLIIVDKAGVAKLMLLETGMRRKSQLAINLAEPNLDGPNEIEQKQVEAVPEFGGKLTNFDRKDVWDVKWATDNPDLFAMTEKTRMYIFRNLDPEEPLNSSGYICDFSQLRVKSVLIDELMIAPENPGMDILVSLDTKSLRDTRNILAQVGIADAFRFVEDNPHPILWRLIGESAMSQLDFVTAQKSFVRSADYSAIQFVKRIQLMNDKYKQKAEVYAYFNQFDLAEKIYTDIDRLDLAIELRIRIGDWFRVRQLLEGSQATMKDDVLMEKTLNSLGDYYMERQKWSQAIPFYKQARNVEKLVDAYFLEESYEELETLMKSLPDGHPLLQNIAEKFGVLGMNDAAVSAYLKINDVKSAIDICVFLNQWDRAIELAEIHRYKEIETLLSTYAKHLLERNKKFNAAELYRKANQHERSAQLLFDLAEEFIKADRPPLQIKKLYVLAAQEVDRYIQLRKSHASGGNSTLDALLQDDKVAISVLNSKYLDNPWRGAEAYHYYLMSQRHIYSNRMKLAESTALHLLNYEDILGVKVVNSLIALTSFKNKNMETCSRALTRLENMNSSKSNDDEDSDEVKYERLALSIFSKGDPVNPPIKEKFSCPFCATTLSVGAPSCNTCSASFPICIATGRPIIDMYSFTCSLCKHKAIDSEVGGLRCCPLCHCTL